MQDCFVVAAWTLDGKAFTSVLIYSNRWAISLASCIWCGISYGVRGKLTREILHEVKVRQEHTSRKTSMTRFFASNESPETTSIENVFACSVTTSRWVFINYVIENPVTTLHKVGTLASIRSRIFDSTSPYLQISMSWLRIESLNRRDQA